MELKNIFSINFFIIFISSIAALGGFILGFDAGVIVAGKDQISAQFHLSDAAWTFITCISIVGSLFIMPLSGHFTDKFGARNMLLLTAGFFIIGLMIAACAESFLTLLTGRFLVGMCIGMASFIVPLFISELAPPEMRGAMVLLNSIAITAGQTISFLVGYFFHDLTPESWRNILWIEAFIAVGFFLAMFYLPHSPRWVAKKRGLKSAQLILQRIRKNEDLVKRELNSIQKSMQHNQPIFTPEKLFSKKMLPVILLGIGLAMLQQFMGVNAVIYYGPVIFYSLGFANISNAILATFFVGVANLFFTIVTAFLVDFIGRRKLLLSGTLLASASMTLMACATHMHVSAFTAVSCVIIYIIGYCISLGSLFWVIVSEIYPHHIRGIAMSFVTALQLLANLIVTSTFLALINFLGSTQTFTLYSIMSLIAFLFIYYYVPETKGVPLELIEANLKRGRKTRELGMLLDEEI